MKKTITILLFVCFLVLTACQDNQIEIPKSSSQVHNLQIKKSESSSQLEDPSCIFTLGGDLDTKTTLKKGDTLGQWVVSKMDCTYDENSKLELLEAEFAGEVTLNGTISRNQLMEYGYDFYVAKLDMDKMPRFSHYDCNTDNGSNFILKFPKELTNTPKLDFNGKVECTITIKNYNFTFAYMTAPATATVKEIVYK